MVPPARVPATHIGFMAHRELHIMSQCHRSHVFRLPTLLMFPTLRGPTGSSTESMEDAIHND
eukprot:9494525-Pyramimonas_sp.AAC.1